MIPLVHPDLSQVSIEHILYALSDPTRLAIVSKLYSIDNVPCKAFEDFGKKNNLSHHYKTLRESGLIHVRVSGRQRFMSLRKIELQEKFPDLIDTIIKSQ